MKWDHSKFLLFAATTSNGVQKTLKEALIDNLQIAVSNQDFDSAREIQATIDELEETVAKG